MHAGGCRWEFEVADQYGGRIALWLGCLAAQWAGKAPEVSPRDVVIKHTPISQSHWPIAPNNAVRREANEAVRGAGTNAHMEKQNKRAHRDAMSMMDHTAVGTERPRCQ